MNPSLWRPGALAPVLAATLCLTSLWGCGSSPKANAAAGGGFRTACHMPSNANDAPSSLLDTGCFASSGDAAAALYGYEVNGVLWADSAEKERWLLVPDTTPASFDGNGVLVLPNGAGVVKQFNRDGRRLETRLLFRNTQGAYEAATYAWNDAGTDASLVPAAGQTVNYSGGKQWEYLGRADCMFCHNPPAGTLLGPRLPQLQRTVARTGGTTVAQLADMVAHNVVAAGFDANVVAWPQPTSDAPVADRARSYLATNCSFCHMPGGYSGTTVDFRYDTPLNKMGICDVAPAWGAFNLAGARVLAPGNPNASILSLRLHSTTPGQKMPPVGHAVTDPNGAALVDAWIASVASCGND